MNHSANIENWLRLNHADGVGPVTFAKLVKHFGSVENAVKASYNQLLRIEGIGEKTAGSIISSRDNFDVEAEIKLADKHGVKIIHLDDPSYPPLLRKIYDPPAVLYIKGDIQRCDNLAISIVGSRRCSLYGTEQASRFAYLLASSGFTIISGLARGIDCAAHKGALNAQGRTIAVQGCGLAGVFPPENEKLAWQIAENGALISELPMTYEPLAENFPGRNRIIAGLSLGVIVIEAMHKSGALLTASAALEYNREVMAVPGKIDSPLSEGPHRLIKQGAKLIENAEDVMEALGYIGADLKQHVAEFASMAQKAIESPRIAAEDLNLSPDERRIFDCLDGEPVHIEQIILSSGLDAGRVNAAVVTLCIKGIVGQLPGNYFRRK